MGFIGALRGTRNPTHSWDKSDSHYGYYQCNVYDHNHLCDKCITSDENNYAIEAPIIGENDMELAKKLIKLEQNIESSCARYLYRLILQHRYIGGKNLIHIKLAQLLIVQAQCIN